MKRALIISYYYPPCHGSASWRPYSWAKYFKQFGIFPVVITRHWHGNEHTWQDYFADINDPIAHTKTDDYELFSLPSKKSKWFGYLFSNNWFLKKMQPVIYYSCMLLGIFNVEVDGYISFKDFLIAHLKKTKYDFVIITLPPPNLLKLISVIKKNSDTKIVVDYRDIWDNLEPSPNYKPDFKKKISNSITKYFMRKWLKQVDFISHVTPPFGEAIKTISNLPQALIFNGYDEEYFENKQRVNNERFTFSMIGSLYLRQDISIMINGLSEFLKDKDPAKVCICLIGLDENSLAAKNIKATLPEKFLSISKRLKKEEAILATVQSDVLFFPAWKGFRGMIGVKPLDYIASGNNILLAPGDDDILDKLVSQTATGKIANSVSEFLTIMNNWYYEWESNGQLKYEGKNEIISFYSRKRQAQIFAQELLKL